MKAGLIGQGIQASLTPEMHVAEGQALGLRYDYCKIDVNCSPYRTSSLTNLVSESEESGFVGLNVTHPFKQKVVPLLDEMSDVVALLGSANSIVFQDGKRIGHNTDYIGYRSALRRALPRASIDTVLLFGAGGAGRAVALALLDQGTRNLFLYDRNPAQSQELQGILARGRPQAHVRVAQDLSAVDWATLDGAVNATPVGMNGYSGIPFHPEGLPHGGWVSDIVYFPKETELIKAARQAGLRTMDGTGMAVFQAVAAFNLFTQTPPDPDRMVRRFDQLSQRNSKEEQCL